MAFAATEMHDETPNEQEQHSDQIEVADTVSPDAEVSENNTRRRSLFKVTRRGLIVFGLLIVILAVGGYFRFVGQNWDDYTHLHPDERFLTGVATSLGGSINPSGNQDAAAQQQSICNDRYPDTKGAATSIFDSLCSPCYPKNTTSSTALYLSAHPPL